MEYCMICSKEMPDYEPMYCCSGRECGCMGLPIEPPICSIECWDNFNLTKEGKNAKKI